MSSKIDDNYTKALIKQAVLELLEERQDMIYDLFADVIEDTFFIDMIREGDKTETVSREEVFKILGGEA